MPVYVKDKSIGTTPVSFTANIDTEWQYFANQDKRTSRGLLSSDSNSTAVSLYGPNPLPIVDQTATPQHIFTPPFSLQNASSNRVEFDLQYPSTPGGGRDTDRICTIQGSNSLTPADWQEVAYFNGKDIKTQTVTQEVLNLDVGNKRFGTNGDGNSSGFRRFGQFGGVPDKFQNYLFLDRDDSSFRTSVFQLADISELTFFVTSGRSGLANAATNTEDGVKWQFGANYGVTRSDYDSGAKSLLVYLVKQVGSQPSPNDIVASAVRAQGRNNEWSRVKFQTSDISGTHYFIFTKQTNSGDEKRHAVSAIQGVRHRIANFAASQRVKLDFDPQGGLNSVTAASNNARPFLANYDLSRKYRWYRIGVKGPTANDLETTGSIVNWVTKSVTGQSDDREGIEQWFPPQELYVKQNSWKPVKQVFIKKDNSWVNVWPDVGQGAATLPPEQEGGGVFINNPDDAPVTSLTVKGFDDYENGLFGRRYNGDWNDDPNFFIPSRRTGQTNSIQKWDEFTSNAYNYSWEWQGYAKIGTSGNYNIRINSDDASAVFFGDNALSGSPPNNSAWVSYLGHHGADGYRTSTSRYLTAGEFYPIRIRFGQWHKGPSEFNFQVKPPNASVPTSAGISQYAFYYNDSVVDDPQTQGNDNRYHVYQLQNGRYERTAVFNNETDAAASVTTKNAAVDIRLRFPTAYAYQLGGNESNMGENYSNTGKYRVVRNSAHVGSGGKIRSGQLTTGNQFTPIHVWAQLAHPTNLDAPASGIVEDQIFDTLAQAQARVEFLNSQAYQLSLDGYYFEHPDFDLVHVGQGFRKVPARSNLPRQGVVSTESTDNTYPHSVFEELTTAPSIADGKLINNTVDVGGGIGTISASRGIGTGNNPSMMPLIKNYTHNSYPDAKAGSMIRDCAVRGAAVNDVKLKIMGLTPSEVDFSTTDITVRIQCRPRGPFALGVLRVNLDDDYFTGKSISQWFRNLDAVRKWAVVKHTGYSEPFFHEYFDVSNVDPKVGIDALNIRGELLNSLNWTYRDVFSPYSGTLAYRQLVSKEFTVTAPAQNEVLIPFVTDFGDWVGGETSSNTLTGMDRVRCEMTYNGYNIAQEDIDATLPVLTEINFDSHTSYVGANAPSILPIIFPIPSARIPPPGDDEDDDGIEGVVFQTSDDEDDDGVDFCPTPTYDPFNFNSIDNDDRDLFSDWDSGWDGTNSGVSVANSCTFNGNSFDYSVPPSSSSDDGGGSSSGGDNSGMGGDPSGDGCVIATHAISTGAFRHRDRANAINWCEKNLHGKWWGEAMRRGYRHLGRRYISEGKAETVYDEFKECMEWANGKRPFELRIATRYFYRVAQTFIIGLCVRDK